MKLKRKTHFIIVLALAVFLTMIPAGSFGGESPAQTGSGSKKMSGSVEALKQEYVVTAGSDLTKVKMPAYVSDITFADANAALVKVESGITQEMLESDLQQTCDVFVQPNFVYEVAEINDPYYNRQWGLHDSMGSMDIDYERAYNYISENHAGRSETVVAVIDSGVDAWHSDLTANMWTNDGEIPGNGKDDDGNGYIDDVHGYDFANGQPLKAEYVGPDYDHGTHCAGTIAAVGGNGIGIAGIAGSLPQVSMMDLKVLKGAEGTGSTFALISAIRYAEERGADICNLSMGSYANDQTLYRTIAASDMLFVCAAGNDRINVAQRPMYPGCYDLNNIVCVGNAERSGRMNSLSNYSSSQVDIAAPGTDIYSTLSGGRYGSMSGTSMAAPFVTGTAALLHAYYEDITAPEMRFLLLDSASIKTGLEEKVAGNRYLNAYRPLTYTKDDYHIDAKAPSLKATVSKISGSYKQRLQITASDDSGRLPKVMYVRGDKSINYFRSGMGYRVSLSDDGKGSKVMAVPSIYSVYAVDAAGNDVLCKVRCTANAVSSISLNYSAKTIAKGKSYTLKATLSKTGDNGRALTWVSSNRNVAAVNAKGKVTAKKKGTAIITVKTSNGLSKKCKITVK